MKKNECNIRILFILSTILVTLFIGMVNSWDTVVNASGNHTHRWNTVSCTKKVCSICGKTTSGSGHDYSVATCKSPKTCKKCGKTEGSKASHSWGSWISNGSGGHNRKCGVCGIKQFVVDQSHSLQNGTCVICKYIAHVHSYSEATCIQPATCSCGKTSGFKAPHNYAPATCTTPMKCKICNSTSGKELGHDYRYTKISNDMHVTNCTRCRLNSNRKHEFSNGKCTLCNATCSHSFGKAESLGPLYHKQTCSICKKTVSSEHPLPDMTSLKCTDAAKCKDCGEVLSKAREHKLVYQSESSSLHYISCKNCNYSTKGSHTFNTKNECTLCNYSKECIHTYKIENVNWSYHKKTCTKCLKEELIYHTPNIDKPTCTQAKTCTECDYVYANKVNHEYVYTRITDKLHVVNCKNCQLNSNQEHKFSNGKCSLCDSSCNHSFGKAESLGPLYHQQTCSICKKTVSSEHPLPDMTSLKCTDAAKCKDCGEVLSKAREHKLVYQSESNALHYISCKNCNYSTKGSHTLNNKNECTLCNYSKECIHTYKIENVNWSYHKKTCTKCLKEELIYHTPNIDKPTCTQAKTCTECDYVYANKVNHEYVYTRITDKLHVVNCKNCQLNSNQEHKFSNGKCSLCKKSCSHVFEKAVSDPLESNYHTKTCTICSYKVSERHKENIDFPTCTQNQICTDCGEILLITTGHKYIYTKYSDEEHIMECKYCDSKSILKHEFKNDKCEQCKYDRDKKFCLHSYETESINRYQHRKYCTKCSYEIAEEHKPNVDKATCTKDKKCKSCEYIYQKSFGHDYEYTVIPSNKTLHKETCKNCKQTANKTHSFKDGTCTLCGYTNAHTHLFSAATCTKPATCSCGAITGTTLEHAWSDWKSMSSAGHNKICVVCNKKQYITDKAHNIQGGTCIICNYTTSQTCSHTETEWQIIDEPTCTTKGKENLVCKNCFTVIKTKETPAEHTFMLKVTQQATCTETGLREQICVICQEKGNMKPQIINKKNHTYNSDGYCSCGAYQPPKNNNNNNNNDIEEKITLEINLPKEAYIGETITISATLKNTSDTTGKITWTANGTEHKLTPNSTTFIAWLRASEKGKITVKASYKTSDGKTISTSKTIKILDVNQNIARPKMALLSNTVTNLNVGVLTKISGDSLEVLGTSVKTLSPGTTILQDLNNNQYEIIVTDEELELTNASIDLNDILYVSEKIKLNVITIPELTTSNIEVKVNNLLKFDETGYLEGIKEGKGSLKIVSNNKTIFNLDLQIKEPEVKLFQVENTKLTTNQQTLLTYEVLPEKLKPNCTIEVSENLSYNSETQTITALKKGKATIKLLLNNKLLKKINITIK